MPGNPLSDPTWAKQLADTIERVVANVRDKTTNNIVLAARGIQVLLDLAVTPDRAVYLSYFVVGGICCLLGWFLMRKRHTPGA